MPIPSGMRILDAMNVLPGVVCGGRSRHSRPIGVLLALVLAGITAACASDSKGTGDGGVDSAVDIHVADTATEVQVSDSASDVLTRDCPAHPEIDGTCSVAPDVSCPRPQSSCAPAGCVGSFTGMCQCHAGHWMCALWECFAPCATSSDGGGGG